MNILFINVPNAITIFKKIMDVITWHAGIAIMSFVGFVVDNIGQIIMIFGIL